MSNLLDVVPSFPIGPPSSEQSPKAEKSWSEIFGGSPFRAPKPELAPEPAPEPKPAPTPQPAQPLAADPVHAGMAEAARACVAAELACAAWLSAALRRSNLDKWRGCIALTLDCLDVCAATGKILTRGLDSDPAVLAALLDACASACATCGAECHRLGTGYPLCLTCGDVCLRTQLECARLSKLMLQRAA